MKAARRVGLLLGKLARLIMSKAVKWKRWTNQMKKSSCIAVADNSSTSFRAGRASTVHVAPSWLAMPMP